MGVATCPPPSAQHEHPGRTPVRLFEHSSARSGIAGSGFEISSHGAEGGIIEDSIYPGRIKTMAETRWLDATQQRHWRAYIDGSVRLHDMLDQSLKATHGLSSGEYEILVRLSE